MLRTLYSFAVMVLTDSHTSDTKLQSAKSKQCQGNTESEAAQ